MIILAFTSITPHIKEFIVHFRKISIYAENVVILILKNFFCYEKQKGKTEKLA